MSNSCVDKKNPIFKELAKAFNLSESDYEQCIHSYWNNGGKEGTFPPVYFVLQYKGESIYYEHKSAEIPVRKLWEQKYSNPLTFSSQSQLDEAKAIVLNYFPQKAIVTYNDNNGKYVLKVREPFDSQSYEKEIKTILENAPRNENGELLAPNGNVSNLTERQYAQVRTKAFKQWFGDWELLATVSERQVVEDAAFGNEEAQNLYNSVSKVVDENGEPLVVYHGATAVFNTFDKNFLGSNTRAKSAKMAFFVSNSLDMARHYKLDPYTYNPIEELLRAQRFDINFTMEDAGISPYDKLPSRVDELYLDKLDAINDLVYLLFNKAANEKYTYTRTLTIESGHEFIFNEDINDLRNQGFIISTEDEIRHNRGESITAYKEETRTLGLFPNVDVIEKDSILSKKYKEELKEYHKKLEELNAQYDPLIDEAKLYELRVKAEDDTSLKQGLNPYVLGLFLNIKNIKIDDDEGAKYRKEKYAKRVEDAIKSGKDGGVIKNTKDPLPCDVYYFFDSNQVKSATDNVGTFDNEEKNILYHKNITEDMSNAERIQERTRQLEEDIFGEKEEITFKEAIDKISEASLGKANPLLKILSAMPEKWLNRTITRESLDKGILGEYDYGAGNIALLRTWNTSFSPYQTLTHELYHALTYDAITLSPELYERVSKLLESAKLQFAEKYGEEEIKKVYGFTNVDEFLSEVASNSQFAKELYSYKGIDNTAPKSFLREVFEIIKAAFEKIFGGLKKENPSLYENALALIEDIYDVASREEVTVNSLEEQLNKEIRERDELLNKAIDEDETFRYYNEEEYNKLPKEKQQVFDNLLLKGEHIARLSRLIGAKKGSEYGLKVYQKVTPTFTFKDGSTIETPFPLNEQQLTAMQTMVDFAKSKETVMTLSGYAGTGKTSLMEILAKKLSDDGIDVQFSATTHKAAAVLKDKVKKQGFETRTVHSLFGVMVETDMDLDVYDTSKKKNTQTKPKLTPGSVVIIDEASMLNVENFNIIVELAKQNYCKIIFVGDKAQLAPVKEKDISIVFRNTLGKVVELTKVERTGDNAILKEATNVRNGKDLSFESSFNDQGLGVAYMNASNLDEQTRLLEAFIPGLKENPNSFRILSFTNDSVFGYNAKVRAMLGYNSVIPQEGEPMMGYANWGYDAKAAKSGKEPYKFINSEAYKVESVGKLKKQDYTLPSGEKLEFEVRYLLLEDAEGDLIEVPFMDVRTSRLNKENVYKMAKLKQKLWRDHKATTDWKVQSAIIDEINKVEKFLFINDNIYDLVRNDKGELVTVVLQEKRIDFGYAHTIHKSLGSTFTHVLMDETGIDTSRASADAKQQLKYVAMTRATDTVTVLTHKAKTEDSPLNHIPSALKPTTQQPTQSLTINVWSTEGEYKDLSNFAERPFSLSRAVTRGYSIIVPKGKDNPTWDRIRDILNHSNLLGVNKKNPIEVKSVEDLFQALKVLYASEDYFEKVGGDEEFKLSKEGKELFLKILNAPPAQAKKWGGKYGIIKGLTSEWDNVSSEIMKNIIKTSFIQNPQALQRLLSTGDATLTHTQDNTKWKTEFPKLLMEVREELRNEQFALDREKIKFTASFSSTYSTRTIENAEWSDITLALALDFSTAGERLTRHSSGNKYVSSSINMNAGRTVLAIASEIMTLIEANNLPKTNVKLNIAGNGLYTLNKYGYNLDSINSIVLLVIQELQRQGLSIAEIRSGGLTGVDEAGIVAALALGIPASVHTTGDYKYRDANGTDISGEQSFKARFDRYLSSNAEPVNVSTISTKTEAYGVEVAKDSRDFWSKVIDWERTNPNGIKAYRRNGDKPESFSADAVNNGWIGNPFSTTLRGEQTVQQFYYWLVTGETFGNPRATEEFRQAIINKILNSPVGTPILYYTELGRPSHATVIGYLINNKEQLSNFQSAKIELQLQVQLDLTNTLGTGQEVQKEIQGAIEVALQGITFELALGKVQSVFTALEIAQIKQTLNGRNLQVMSVSRNTDPAFFSKQIISFLEQNARKPFTDPTRVNCIELWTKHDGMPIANILKACKKYKVAPMVSFSITGMGDTALEKGVMKYGDLLSRIGLLISKGYLNPSTTTVRIDPILIGETNLDTIKTIVQEAKKLGIKKFVTSMVQSYGSAIKTLKLVEQNGERYWQKPIKNGTTWSTMLEKVQPNWIISENSDGTTTFDTRMVVTGINRALAKEGRTYDWDKYYGRDSKGTINFKPKQQYIDEVGKVLLELNQDPEIELETCAFSIAGLKASACLDPLIIERVTGIDVTRPDKTYDRDTSRPECMCYGNHSDMFRWNEKQCFSSCAYCYAAHSGDNNLNYYNPDGTIKQNQFTNVEDKPTIPGSPNADLMIILAKDRNELESNPTVKEKLQQGMDSEIPVFAYIEADDAWYVRLGDTWFALKPLWTENTIGVRGTVGEQGNNALRSIMGKAINPMAEVERDLALEKKEEPPLDRSTVDNNLLEWFDKRNKLNQQFVAILNSKLIGRTEIRDIAESLVNLLSDHLDLYIADPKKLFAHFKVEPFDIENMSRLDIINKIGLANWFTHLKDAIAPYDAEKGTGMKYTKISTMKKVKLVLDNFDAVMYLASNALSANEGMHLVLTDDRINVEETTPDNVNDLNDADNALEVQETLGSTQEKWQIDVRTLDTLLNMTSLVRRELAKLYVLDANGNRIKNEFGIYKRANVAELTNALLKWCQGCITREDMIANIEKHVSLHKGLQVLIDNLKKDDGTMSDFQSSFFSTFDKHFQLYSATMEQYNDKGELKTYSANLNLKQALKAILKGLEFDIKQMGSVALFYKGGRVNKELADKFKKNVEQIEKIRGLVRRAGWNRLSEELKNLARNSIAENVILMGYPVDTNIINEVVGGATLSDIGYNMSQISAVLDANKDNAKFSPFAQDGIKGYYSKVLNFFTQNLEDITDKSIFDDGKMYQSNIIPSYMTKLNLKFHEKDLRKFDKFIEDEFGKYEWFRNTSKPKGQGWREGLWIQRLATDSSARETFDHRVELNNDGDVYMKTLSPSRYVISILSNFFSEGAVKAGNQGTQAVAWYRIPMMSNKPSLEYIKFYADMGSNYKTQITNKLYQVFLQEIRRIQTVRMSERTKSDPLFIKNFHENGGKFCFLDFLNEYLQEDSRYKLKKGSRSDKPLGELLLKILKGNVKLETLDADNLESWVKQVILNNIDARATEILADYAGKGIIEASKSIEGLRENTEENIRKFIWNDFFASTQILELTLTDIAYYKDMEDLQKRLAQIHAPGLRGDWTVRDYNGKLVSDGKLRTMYLKDFDKVKSNIIENVTIALDRKILAVKAREIDSGLSEEDKRKATEDKDKEIAGLELTKEYIIDLLSNLNVADALGYSCPTSYRKKAYIFGQWNKKAEDMYQQIKKGTYTFQDLDIALQPLKPFVYTQISKPSNVPNAPLQTLKVGMQNKNSEYLLMMADAIIGNQDTGRPNLLRALYNFMEYSLDADPTRGIDTIQFESTVKAGLMGVNDLNDLVENPNGEKEAYDRLLGRLYATNADGTRGYNQIYVHEIPVEDYCIQLEMPAHFRGHKQAHGSLLRMIIPSDLAYFDDKGNEVFYEVEGRLVKANEFRSIYENVIAKNINESISQLEKELMLNGSPVERNIVISRLLQKEILSSPRYGIDMYMAVSLDPRTGKFRLPLGDPTQSKRIEQLLNSIIKKRVNNQEIAGGPIVQTTNFGLSKRLSIKFKDKENGEELKTKEEFYKNDDMVVKYKTYDKYKEQCLGGIAYFECFAPIFANEVFQKFADDKGNIDIKAIEKVAPETLKMIGFRIPTEDKYSAAPLKIVGFLPKEAGEVIMLPWDITGITGSDFDADKEYTMRKEINVDLIRNSEGKVDWNKIRKSMEARVFATRKGLTEQLKKYYRDAISNFTSDVNYYKNKSAFDRELYDIFLDVAYEVSNPKDMVTSNNNTIVDMTWEVLTHETSVDKVLNPGGFAPEKKMGYMVAAYINPKNSHYTWEELEAMSEDELKKLSVDTKNLCYIDLHVQFYALNNDASSGLGMFAVQKVAHATLENNGYYIDVLEIGIIPFRFGGIDFGYSEIDPTFNTDKQYIGRIIGEHVAASADAAKEPCLNLMNINKETINVYSTMLRMGVSFKDATLFMSLPIIAKVIAETQKRRLEGVTTLSEVINEYISEYQKDSTFNGVGLVEREELTREEMIGNLRPKSSITNLTASPKINYKVLLLFTKMSQIAESIRGITYNTRFNSITNAVGPLIIDNMITKSKALFSSAGLYKGERDKAVELTQDVIYADHPILGSFYDAYRVADTLFEDFPVMSKAFRDNVLGENPDERIYKAPLALIDRFMRDRKLLSQLADFFMSRLLIDSDVIPEEKLPYYILEFPMKFMEMKKNYPNNKFVQAIQGAVNNDTDLVTLSLDTNGMKQYEKDRLSDGWWDLYNTDRDLAMDLFYYNFFKGGIGFNPKTFMSLLPEQMRESIPGYKKTYTNIWDSWGENVLEQFLQHNTTAKLFANRKEVFDPVAKTLKIEGERVKQFLNTPTFRAKDSRGFMHYYLLDSLAGETILYREIVPLGNKGDFLELSSSRIPLSMVLSYNMKRNKATSSNIKPDITKKESAPEESDGITVVKTDAQKKSDAERVLLGLTLTYPGVRTEAEAKNLLQNVKKGVIDRTNEIVEKYMKMAFDNAKLEYNLESLLKVLEDKNICG